MGFDGDLCLWKEFSKSVERIDRSNIVVPGHLPIRSRVLIKSADNELFSFINNRKSMNHVRVECLDRASVKKFKSQRSIDLHGYTREVDETLEVFCSQCILTGIREIIVITGKGAGIVKSATERWLGSHPEFVIGFFKIKDFQGESGSFGVRLRAR